MLFFLLFTSMVGCNEEEIKVTPQNELVAVAGADKTILVNEEVILDGSGSYDKNNKPFTYFWSIKTKPQGSVVPMGNSNAAKATFKPDVAGTYVIQLRITQDQWSAEDELRLTVNSNNPNVPVVSIISENINSNRTLNDIFEDATQPDYIVTHDILVNADLVIMPGVVIAFEEDKGIEIVNGSIRAIGTSDKGITFKGLGDRPSYWKGILLHSNHESNELKYVAIKQAGSSAFTETGIRSNLTLVGSDFSGATLSVTHAVFSESGGYGFYAQGLSLLTHFANNAFLTNAKTAFIPANQLHKIDVVSFTGTDGFETGGLVQQHGDITWKKLAGGSYRVTNDIHIKAGVTIEAGTSFKMKTGTSIDVLETGYLKAIGTADFRVTFTSASPIEHWNGILFNSWNQNNILSYSYVSDAGLNKLGGAAFKANIVVGEQGLASVENSIIKNGLGYGVVAKSLERINGNVALVNNFENLASGRVFPTPVGDPDQPPVAGVWLDQWSFNQGANAITANFYNQQTGTWFNGASNPWTMASAGFGIQIDENGNFTWTIAEHSPMIGCESYSAEYIMGKAAVSPDKISFDIEYWRSKFINSCDETQNVDTGVTPFELSLPYQITKVIRANSEEVYWQLKFKNPDNSTFSFYRR